MRSVLSVDTVQLRSDVLERRVVGDHFEAARWYGLERLVKTANVPEGHTVHLEAYGQVESPVAGDQHGPVAQRGEVHVVQPGGVQSVGVASVHREQGGRLLGHV